MTPEALDTLRKKNKLTNMYVSITGANHADSVRDLFLKGKLTLVSATHKDTWFPEYEVDLKDARSISTYENCVTVVLNQDETVQMKIYSGRMTDGSRRGVRATFVLQGEWWNIPGIKASIDNNWFQYTKHLMLEELDAKQELRRQAIGVALLGGHYHPVPRNG